MGQSKQVQLIDLSNRRFGRLSVIGRVLKDKCTSSRHSALWLCQCDCGNRTGVRSAALRSLKTKSCGCYNAELRLARNYSHRLSKTALYKRWAGMITRCSNPKVPCYKYYGGRGISVCDSWKDFENFYRDMGNPPSPKMTIGRIDNNGNYEPSNCRWETWAQQNMNKGENTWRN